MNKPIQRWDVDCDDIDASMFTNKTGDYVLYADHLEALEEHAKAKDHKDTEMLDWLQQTRTWEHSGDGYYESKIVLKWGDSIKRRSLREAIAASIAQPKETK